MSPSDSGRSEVLRITLSAVAWCYFEGLRDTVRCDHPEADVPQGDQGTRLVLRTWIEEAIRDAVGEVPRSGTRYGRRCHDADV